MSNIWTFTKFPCCVQYNTNTGQDLKLNYLSVKSNISLILCGENDLNYQLISQLYSDHRDFCYGFCLHLQLSFRWLRNIPDFSDGFTQQSQCIAVPTLVWNIFYNFLIKEAKMRGWQSHTSHDVSIVSQTDNTEIFYTLHFLLCSGPQLL